ncbi:MAG: hypothetical protein A3G39_01785 [Deltaproteobacteria bacterium RIFCSPLOWO2_12_FULL_43_16]|nr:MAG: hypothetical protein A2Z89_05505 [Deltaproteobacteria bacterium GWA2_43_19]OGQ11494.1 MAG: hypothetical protein A3D30_09425 [Deltaproteobacteria bacterium RIFCSPHIGHO2_02_FULL_43_33]OGQ40198.1 MAG: hypothetical protein A3A85_00965 [Deltaproteobacteria bacterium RIFCSPLOWO2_01_FULL_42_9]OGQ60635.1 MAG: hypothetical protein A3G39_01785 [Deltaproteobacteria bacterium RIFCSPLOWO2_12_FULL_43_16]HBR17274.1 hypothetical protein [Deltaproteobacteria bacterium]
MGDMLEKKRGFAESIKPYNAIISIFIPLITAIIMGYFQLGEYVRKSSDANFRSVVEKLSSGDEAQRLAAASSIGTFIKKGGEYSDEAAVILMNRLSIELDYNVLNAIIGSLEKTRGLKKAGDEKIINDLLAIERNFFIQEYPLKEWRDGAGKYIKNIEQSALNQENLYKKYKSEVDKVTLDGLKKEMGLAWEDYYKRDKNYVELKMHDQVVTDAISILLRKMKYGEIKPLELQFYQNSLNNAIIADMDLSKSTIKRSAFSASSMLETKFNSSHIIHTVFTFSNLTKSSFVDCTIIASLFDQISSLRGVSFFGSEFKDVFFAGSDITGANFKGTRGLEPIYFYAAKHPEKAEFDAEFKQKLDEELPKITEEEFIKYVDSSELSESRRKDLLLTLDELKDKRVKDVLPYKK